MHICLQITFVNGHNECTKLCGLLFLKNKSSFKFHFFPWWYWYFLQDLEPCISFDKEKADPASYLALIKAQESEI